MADEFGVTFCKDIICLHSLPVCFSDTPPVLLHSTWTDTLVIKPVGSMLLIPKPTTGHNPVPVVSTYSSHSFLTSHPLGVIRCCFLGGMHVLCAFPICIILSTLLLYTQKLSFSFCTLLLWITLLWMCFPLCVFVFTVSAFLIYLLVFLFVPYIQCHTIVQPRNNNMQYEVGAQQLHVNVFSIRLFPMPGSQVKLYVCHISFAFFVWI
jgi:hypothetical protein